VLNLHPRTRPRKDSRAAKPTLTVRCKCSQLPYRHRPTWPQATTSFLVCSHLDLEVYSPASIAWLAVSSFSNFTAIKPVRQHPLPGKRLAKPGHPLSTQCLGARDKTAGVGGDHRALQQPDGNGNNCGRAGPLHGKKFGPEA